MKKWTFLLVAIFVTLCLVPSGCVKKEYSLTIAASGQGTTVPATGTYTYQGGRSVIISATPASGWKFDSWTGDASGTSPIVSLLMDGKKAITANFSKITYTLTLVANGNGATSPPAGAHIYDAGTTVKVTANPGTGWKFDSWSGDVTGSSATVSIPMDGNKSLTANFAEVTYKAVTDNFLRASQAFGPYSVHIDRGSGDLKVSSITTGDRVHFSFTVAGSHVNYYSVSDPYGNIILTGLGGNAVASGRGSFMASTSGDYKLHFRSSGIIRPLVVTVYYTIYFAS